MGGADGDAEVGVGARAGVFAVFADGEEDGAGGKGEGVGVVDVGGIGETARDGAEVLPSILILEGFWLLMYLLHSNRVSLSLMIGWASV